MEVETKAPEKKALLEHFADMEDPRTRQSMYDLQELLLTAICAVLCGADGWAAYSGPLSQDIFRSNLRG